MSNYFLKTSFVLASLASVVACSKQDVLNDNELANEVTVKTLSPDMEKVRDYVPQFAVLAHRGSTFWVPEETEAAFRWAREIGADYIEADLQVSKDGVLLALHDDNLKRTTDIENVFGEDFPEKQRRKYYQEIGLSQQEIDAEIKKDKLTFMPNLPSSYTYEELMMLDAGSWFNISSVEQARESFSKQKQYISTLEDLVKISKGKKLKRDALGNRIYSKGKITSYADAKAPGKTNDVWLIGDQKSIQVPYTFEYEDETPEAWSGNVPGIYIEFKEPWLNPTGFEKKVYDELARLGMNIAESPATETAFYKNGKVNVGNTNGKVILQTFSLQSLIAIKDQFKGRVPMCFLLWKGTGATDLKDDSPAGYASFINLGVDNLAHFIGPSIAGAPNNYPEMLAPWQAHLIHRSKMGIHPYSFDSQDQMRKYFGDYDWGNTIQNFKAPYLDAAFTNRSELTLQYFIDKGVRHKDAEQVVRNPVEVLEKLGY